MSKNGSVKDGLTLTFAGDEYPITCLELRVKNGEEYVYFEPDPERTTYSQTEYLVPADAFPQSVVEQVRRSVSDSAERITPQRAGLAEN